ncbi:glyoxal oxidase N-terminus-domain-containing protein [Mycena crocata]|nr:glyoxal oxidase N-terminus-domain-containing protein [Mycena crocata]
MTDNKNLTMEACVASCAALNFTIAGGEFSVQCCARYFHGYLDYADAHFHTVCGNELIEGSVPAPQSECNMACGGNSTQCAAFGYTAGGMEFGSQCYCGDVSDVVKSGFTLQPEMVTQYFSAVAALESSTTSGQVLPICGILHQLLDATRQEMNSLPTFLLTSFVEISTPCMLNLLLSISPRVTKIFRSVVVPLIATVGINNKVTFLEKSGTSEFRNSTGAYELDLSLASNFSAAWRTMHVKSDVFCSGSITLPDKGARQLNVGGWSLDSTKGVRLYTPDGSPGVNGTNDWEENFQELHLQRQRWYPTAAMLPNGTIMVIGGETGSNASPEPNVEILPTPKGGDTVIFLDWLNRTDPNNLYPFVFVLPSGSLFVVYYNEARILNAATFDTIRILPNIPGSVNNFLSGRTYPLEGAAVMFPQHAPYTDPLEVLVCGGSTPGAGIALDNCVSIQPEVENSTWALERMPSARVMPCMVTLPDGTFLILNGAVQGVAGFGLANDPNLGALLYDPSMPFNQRISILNTTIVARLYHSEAILLPDGRVLVSGSDPESPTMPEEFRIEVYIPPYLAQGLTQPSFTITNTDWTYGSKHSISVTLHHGTTSTMKGLSDSGCAENSCTITAPPNAFVSPPGWHQLFILDGPTPSHSSWVRIGGDPAGLGNWPNLPDFTLPGV